MSSPTVRVVAAVISRGDRVLVCQRPAHKRHGGLWEFPGGKCEPDESFEAAARRELAEELDVDVVAVGAELYSVRDPGSAFQLTFVPVTINSEPKCIEHVAISWSTVAELIGMAMAPGDRSFAEFLVGGAA